MRRIFKGFGAQCAGESKFNVLMRRLEGYFAFTLMDNTLPLPQSAPFAEALNVILRSPGLLMVKLEMAISN